MPNERVNILIQQKGAQKTSKDIRSIGVASKLSNKAVSGLRSQLALLASGFALIKSVQIVANFGQEMATVQAITGATAKEFDALRATAKKLGAETRFSGTQAAEAMKFLARAGFDTNEVLGSVAGTLQLAQAGALDLGRAADIASNILTGFRLETDQTARVVNVLAQAANSGNTDVSQLGEAMKFVAPVATGLGVSLEETAAAIVALSDAGLQGTLAGTGLRLILAKMASTTPNATKALAKMGLTIDEINPRLVGLTGAFEALDDAGATIEDMFKIFDIRGGPAAEILSNSTLKMKDLTEAFKEGGNFAERVANIMDNTLTGSLFRLLSAIQDVIISFADLGFGDALKNSADAFARTLLKISNNLESIAKWAVVATVALTAMFAVSIIASAGGLLAVMQGIVLAVQFLVSISAGAVTAIGAILTWPVLLAGLIAGVITAVILFRDQINLMGIENGTLGDLFRGVWVVIIQPAVENVVSLFKDLNALVTNLVARMKELKIEFDFLAQDNKFLQLLEKIVKLSPLLLMIEQAKMLGTALNEFVIEPLVEAGRASKTLGEETTKAFSSMTAFIESAESAISFATGAVFKFSKEVKDVEPIENIFEGLEQHVGLITGTRLIKDMQKEMGRLAEITMATTEAERIRIRIKHELNDLEAKGARFTKQQVDELVRLTNLAQNLTGIKQALKDLFPSGDTFMGADFANFEKFADMRFAEDAGAQQIDQIIQAERDLIAVRNAGTEAQRIGIEVDALARDMRASGLIIDDAKIESLKKIRIQQHQNNLTVRAGITDAGRALMEDFADVGSSAFDVVMNAFSGMEDALTSFVKTGKLDFADFANSIIDQMIRIAIQQAILKPILGAFGFASGGAFAGGIQENATGGAYNSQGVSFFAQGGIVNDPVAFQTNNGLGVAGEAGPEGILPLKRLSNGDLGVQASGGGGGTNVFAPQINVTVEGAEDAEVGADQGRQVAIELERALETSMTNFIRKQKRAGNQLNRQQVFD